MVCASFQVLITTTKVCWTRRTSRRMLWSRSRIHWTIRRRQASWKSQTRRVTSEMTRTIANVIQVRARTLVVYLTHARALDRALTRIPNDATMIMIDIMIDEAIIVAAILVIGVQVFITSMNVATITNVLHIRAKSISRT